MVMISFFKKKTYKPGALIRNYKILEKVGEGRYGVSYLVALDDDEFILKTLKPKSMKKSGHKIIFEEEILSSLDHLSIPRIIDTIKEDDIYAYVLEYKSGKTIEEMIFGDGYRFTPCEIHKIGLKMISIVKYLHEKNIVHRDIRIPNVIMDNEEVYLIDFGLARFVNNKRYIPSVDFSYLGQFFLHLYYSSFEKTSIKSKPWHEELVLSEEEMIFLKKLLGIEKRYENIYDVERDFLKLNLSKEDAVIA
ncbi:protein kinase [Clostridium sp. SHJSY1]|uniref:serine/threonine protein kinase n=1 Tax=Clostridium sp. SHJSY1 TaxID=2942483 RepID=UPI0028763D57|nr:protein kinase [Clostridium sp. SHJSY1]MDS0524857.1 protein kinase [Clostridium sp. SHJSY1]